MNETPNKFPCKFCFHDEKEHFIFDDSCGHWEYLADVGHEVWVEEPYARPVCNSCGSDCIFEEMTNLDYLEWKYDTNRNSKH